MGLEDSHILLAFITYLVAAASPGPATIAIMGIAMDRGRQSALIFAAGVLLGSFIWALLAIFGVVVLLAAHANWLYGLKIAGGLYLLWLSYQSLRKLDFNKKRVKNTPTLSEKRLFIQGLGLHLTNPKAIFSWVAIVSLALPQSISMTMSFTVVLGCMVLGMLVFGGYAILFSTQKAQRAYKKLGNWFNGILSVVFGVAGFKLLSS